MDCVGRLIEEIAAARYAEKVRACVVDTPLAFVLWTGLSNARDMSLLRQTSETGGDVWAIEFARGKYDNWAAVVLRWLSDDTVEVAWPRDEHYFSRLALLGLSHGSGRVYRTVQSVYALADSDVRQDTVEEIGRLSGDYGDDANLMFNMLMHVYYGMVAEEHYQRARPDGTVQWTRVGEVMKMHALHRMLLDRVDVMECATECCGRDTSRILNDAATMGIVRREPPHPYSSVYDDPSMLGATPYGARSK